MVYTGNSSYCYSNSLHMCLQYAGMEDLPSVSIVECLTGMPFGSCFFNFEAPIFFPSPVGVTPHEGVSQALATMGWQCEMWQSDDKAEAHQALEDALQAGPVLLGPIDMGFLSYDPNHKGKAGGDHFVVILGIEDDMVTLHDPQFYPYVVLPLAELMTAWNASTIGYIEETYTLRHTFREVHKVARDQQLQNGLPFAHTLQTDVREGPVAYTGAAAFRKALTLIEPTPTAAFAGFLTHFVLPIGARRSHDAMQFMQAIGHKEMAHLYETKAKLFGRTQYEATTQQWAKVANRFRELAELEGALSERFVI